MMKFDVKMVKSKYSVQIFEYKTIEDSISLLMYAETVKTTFHTDPYYFKYGKTS